MRRKKCGFLFPDEMIQLAHYMLVVGVGTESSSLSEQYALFRIRELCEIGDDTDDIAIIGLHKSRRNAEDMQTAFFAVTLFAVMLFAVMLFASVKQTPPEGFW